MVRLEGLEPSAYRLKGDYSTTELQPHKKQDALLFKFHYQHKRSVAGCVFNSYL